MLPMRHHFIVLMLATAVGCGGGGISVGDLPDEIVGAQCDQAVACQTVVDRATCDKSVGFDDGEYGTIEAGVKDGTIKYNGDKAEACADGIGDTSCTFPGFHEENACDDVFTGTVPTGGACLIDLQCANFGECEQTDPNCDNEIACCPGTCMGTATESPIGGPCANELNFCAQNSFCKQPATGGAGTCTALVATEGGACDELDACVNPMYCNLNFTSGAGTCKTPAARNATCSRMDLLPCADSRDYCDMTQLKCIPRVAVGAACPTGTQCVGYASCIAGTCVADIAPGGACQVETGPDCAGNLDCIGGVCALAPDGLTCMLP